MTKSKLSKKRMILYLALIAAIIAGNFYIFNKNKGSNLNDIDFDVIDEPLVPGVSIPATTPPVAKDKEIKSVKDADSVVQHNLFQALKKIGNWPINPVNVGKIDPFAPIPELVEDD